MNELVQWLDLPGTLVEVDDEYQAINRYFIERRWSDGLPIVPPTEERVAAMLAYCDRPLEQPVGKIAPRYGEATPIRLAINAVMAGCEPEYFPVVIAAVEAVCEKPFNLYAVQGTTHMVTPLVIVNGPIAKELNLNSGYNAFGPGNQANATIGRALRLALMNIGGGLPGAGDMATFGAPSKYTYCVAENEAENPWEPLHVERGLAAETSAVTVIGGEPPHNVNDHASNTAEGVLRMTAGTMTTTGNNDIYNYQDGTYPGPLVIFGPEHAKTIADGGYSKADVKRWLFEHTHMPLSAFSKENIETRFRVKYGDVGLDTMIPVFKRPEDLLIAVIGGPGKHSAIVPTFGATTAVTRALVCADGQALLSVAELRRS